MKSNIDINEGNNVELAFSDRELKASPAFFMFSSSFSLVDDDGESKPVDTTEIDNNAIFSQNYKYWNQETEFSSTNNLDNSYFKGIVDMGVEAVPYILTELEKGPTPLVYALDLIFPDVMQYNGFVSLKDACDKWLSILRQID